MIQETRGWDEQAGTTHSQRSKEQAHDYRYFPDPDLVPYDMDAALIERVRATLPETPYERWVRYVDTHGINRKAGDADRRRRAAGGAGSTAR